jgi:hypothetical protein
MQTVVIPRRSSSAAIRPTVWLQIGQAGTRSATSTPSSTSNCAAAGAESRISRRGAVIKAHERAMALAYIADATVAHELMQAIDREGEVWIGLDATVVECLAAMRVDQ